MALKTDVIVLDDDDGNAKICKYLLMQILTIKLKDVNLTIFNYFFYFRLRRYRFS